MINEAQIEAAAKAVADAMFPRWVEGDRVLRSRDEGSLIRTAARAALVAAQGAAPAVSGSTSDGYHTFDELYEYRMLYNAHAAHGWLAAGIPVVKSWKHSDGEPCFGGGWFIVTATLPAGQVSNHYEAKHWGLFRVPEVELQPEYDGHTPQDAAMRLRIEAEHAAPVQPSSTVDEAAHDAEVAAKALEDAADSCPLTPVGDWLRARAAEYREESQGLDQDNDWNDPLPDEWRNEWKYVAGEVLAAADALVTVDGLQERIEDTLAYYQCRETNPKADHPIFGYHAFSEEQREFLRARKSEAAAEIVRMILALLRGGEGRCRDCSRPAPARDMLCRNCLAKSEVGG